MENENIVYLNRSHTVSEDQAVMLMLGSGRDFYYEVEGELYDYLLIDYLNDKQEAADAEYSNAKYDLYIFEKKIEAGAPEDEQELRALKDAVDEKKTLLEKAHAIVTLAQEYVYLITDEVAKVKNHEKSLIRLDPDETKKMGCNQITRKSFHDWFSEISKKETKQEKGHTSTEIEKSTSGTTAQKNNQITTFLLAKALAELVDKARKEGVIVKKPDRGYKPNDLVKEDKTLNISALAHYLKQYTDPIKGQKERTLKKRLKNAEQNTSAEDIEPITVEELEDSLKIAADQSAEMETVKPSA